TFKTLCLLNYALMIRHDYDITSSLQRGALQLWYSEPGYETVGSKDLICEDWMVNTRTDADLSAAVQNALQTLLPQIREEIREEFRTGSGSSNASGNPTPVTIHTWLERFNKQKPHSFEKATTSVDAENWISHMEKIFDVMGYEDAFMTRLAVYKFEGNAHSIRQTSTETSTEFMQRFLRLAGFLGAVTGTEEEQAKNFQWGLRSSNNNNYSSRIPVMDGTEILHERDDDDAERPDKRQKSGDRHQPTSQQSSQRNHGHNNDRHGSDRRGIPVMDVTKETGVISPTDLPILVLSNPRVPLRATLIQFTLLVGVDTKGSVVELQADKKPGASGRECRRAAGTCFKCGQAGHLQKDCKKNTNTSTSGQTDRKLGASCRVFAIIESQAANTSASFRGLPVEGANEELSDRGSPRVIVYGYDGLLMLPVAPPSPDYIPGPEEPQTPPAPQDEDEHELMFIQAHDPDFVPEPIYLEYIPLEDEYILLAEEQPLPPVVSPTAESLGYVAESDLEEDPEEDEEDETENGLATYPMDGGDDGDDDDGDSSGYDADDEDEEDETENGLATYPMDGGDDGDDDDGDSSGYDADDEDEDEEKEEEHLAPADSADYYPTADFHIPFIRGRGERLARCTAPVALLSPPLPPLLYPPPVDRRDDILESKHPPRKRLCLSTLGSRQIMAPVTRQGQNPPPPNTDTPPYHMTLESMQAMMDQALLRNSTNGENQVKFATCTLLDAALTWWNSQIRTLGLEAYAMTWEVLKKKMTDKAGNKRKTDDTSRNNHGHQQQPFKKQNVAKKCHKCNKVGHFACDYRSSGSANVANAMRDGKETPKGNGCFECGASGHFKRDCPKLKKKIREIGMLKDGCMQLGMRKNTNTPMNPDSNVVTGTFLLNNRFASILFDTGADRSFISIAFSSLVNIDPTPLGSSYDVELADGK
nr:hypothetical protein [Tanacetum cinerariifolium]